MCKFTQTDLIEAMPKLYLQHVEYSVVHNYRLLQGSKSQCSKSRFNALQPVKALYIPLYPSAEAKSLKKHQSAEHL